MAQHVAGENRGKIILYALSTCVWCRKTKKLLEELGVAYDFIDVDLESGAALQQCRQELQRWNPLGSFPTLIINDSECVVGFDEDEITRAVLKEDS